MYNKYMDNVLKTYRRKVIKLVTFFSYPNETLIIIPPILGLQ